MHKKSVFLIGVLGGLVGYACGVLATPGTAAAQQQGSTGSTETPAYDAGSAPSDPPPPTNPPAPACKQWEVRTLSSLLVNDSSGVLTVPEGWEPFAHSGTVGIVALRRCIR